MFVCSRSKMKSLMKFGKRRKKDDDDDELLISSPRSDKDGTDGPGGKISQS